MQQLLHHYVCFHHLRGVYLDENKEMRVALHLPPCKFQTVFLFPAVMLIAGEALRELKTGEKNVKLNGTVGEVAETKALRTFLTGFEM